MSINPGYTYLASPYSHPLFEVRVRRFIAAQNAAVRMARDGVPVFSPIVHWHHIATLYDLPKDFEFWKAHNDPFIHGCANVIILGIEGWHTSKGVSHEVHLATTLNKDITFHLPSAEENIVVHKPHDWTAEEFLSQLTSDFILQDSAFS